MPQAPAGLRSRAQRWAPRLAPAALLLVAACGSGGGSAAPVQVSDLEARPEDRAVLLLWTAQDPSIRYRVLHSARPGVDPATASAIEVDRPPFLHEGLPNDLPRYYVVVARSHDQEAPPSNEVWATPAELGDPLFKDQWNLENTGQAGGLAGEDANLRPAWEQGYQGQGVHVAIVDDGLELMHPDLAANVAFGASHDYTDGDDDPTGGSHGTACAGIAAARGSNGLGLRGAAPRARLLGYNFLLAPSLSNQVDAMVRGIGLVDVASNSWGAEDGTGDLAPAPAAWREAIEQGLAQGRGGRGIVYVIAAGNGHRSGVQGGFGVADDSNYDGFANHHGLITVGAVDDRGRRATYSERGANLLVCAPSARDGGPPSVFNQKISTTDRSGSEGYNAGGFGLDYEDAGYTRTFDGTSAATPVVSAVAALVLQRQPDLSWRDVREILALSARRNDPAHEDWVQSPAGPWVNHDYGFGVVDAGAALDLAARWSPVGPRIVFEGERVEPNLPIPDADPSGVGLTLPISGSGIEHIEFVEVVLRSDHPFPPDLQVVLIAPIAGVEAPFVSVLARPHDTIRPSPQRLEDWRFGSARHLGQPADGVWRLFVADHAAGDQGRIEAVQLIFRGR